MNCLLITFFKTEFVVLDFHPEKFVNAHQGMLEADNGSTFRIIYYPPLGEEPLPDTTRCGEHTDYGTFTLLAQDTEGGLEVTDIQILQFMRL